MKLQHVIESQQFTLPMLNELFSLADQMGNIIARRHVRLPTQHYGIVILRTVDTDTVLIRICHAAAGRKDHVHRTCAGIFFCLVW